MYDDTVIGGKLLSVVTSVSLYHAKILPVDNPFGGALRTATQSPNGGVSKSGHNEKRICPKFQKDLVDIACKYGDSSWSRTWGLVKCHLLSLLISFLSKRGPIKVRYVNYKKDLISYNISGNIFKALSLGSANTFRFM